MTAPVKAHITPGEGPFCGSNFTISFFVPPDRQQATPPPTSSLVRLTQEPPVTAYVGEFPGFAREASVVQHASELAAALQADGVKFDPEHYVSCAPHLSLSLVWCIGEGPCSHACEPAEPTRRSLSLSRLWGGCVRVARLTSSVRGGGCVGSAGYDAPFRLIGRHNEIWFFAP